MRGFCARRGGLLASVAVLFYFVPVISDCLAEANFEHGAMKQELKNESFSFLVAADAHYGQSMWSDNEVGNKAAIAVMNGMGDERLPAPGWGALGRPKGLIFVGDLTDTANRLNWRGYSFPRRRTGFQHDYPAAGGGGAQIHFPVFEGYGNHDIAAGRKPHWIPEQIALRNRCRTQALQTSPNGVHYSWDWGGLHFININLYAGMGGDTLDSLEFLRGDLAAQVGDSGRPVVICQHYGFDQLSRDWWSDAERDAFHRAIEAYNVAAIFCGHWHAPEPSRIDFRGIPSFVPGRVAETRFFAVKVWDGQMLVAGWKEDGWSRHWIVDL
jgi:cytolysin (calcineurin-like family phosphatase)